MSSWAVSSAEDQQRPRQQVHSDAGVAGFHAPDGGHRGAQALGQHGLGELAPTPGQGEVGPQFDQGPLGRKRQGEVHR